MLAFLALNLACGPAAPAESDPPDTGDSRVDTDDSGAPENHAPGTPVIGVLPLRPPAGWPITASVTTEATDIDGDPVTYAWSWTVDGAGAAVDGPEVPAERTVDGQIWTVTALASDGRLSGEPATASVTIGNAAPSLPSLSFSPDPPVENQPLELVMTPASVDPDGDPVTVSITWYENDVVVPWYQDLTVIEKKYVSIYDTFRAVVSVTDGYHDPQAAEASITVEYGCENLPPTNLGDTSLSATAYHGVAFDDDGNLIGLDSAASSLVKSEYGGTSSLFVPSMPGIQQIDRLPDGDFVMADSYGGRLLRVTAAGGSETIAGGLSGIYGVTVGPDGMVYVCNGSVHRIDPDTGEQELYLSGSYFAHDVDFNLDSTVMYIGTIGAGVLSVELDDDLDPTGSAKTYATGATYIDGLELDECGNVYAADYGSASLYRYEPDGTSTSMVTSIRAQYGHGLAWGHGVGGWATDTLYQPQPYNYDTVREVVIGLQSGDSVRTWLGTAVPW